MGVLNLEKVENCLLLVNFTFFTSAILTHDFFGLFGALSHGLWLWLIFGTRGGLGL